MFNQIINRIFLVSIFIFLAITSKAISSTHLQESDPLNTYQYNRGNYFAGNGNSDQSPWFEWWYYKVVIPEKHKAFYFVYGVANPWDFEAINPGSRSFVGMGSYSDNLVLNQKFFPKEFFADYHSTQVIVGNNNNNATEQSLTGAILGEKGDTASWNININKLWTFNSTSWATGKNLTKIEWYPAQADARCSGEVYVNGVKEVFANAPCYQDRNWGSEFPEWWAWVVSNNFENSPGTALAVGGGKTSVTQTGNSIAAVTIGFKYKGQEYTWRPPSGDLVRFDIYFGKWEIEGINKNNRIKISAFAPRDKFMDLQFLTPSGRIFHDYEALLGDVKVDFYERSNSLDPTEPIWKLKQRLISHEAGVEYGSY